jgi:hypothetical protein
MLGVGQIELLDEHTLPQFAFEECGHASVSSRCEHATFADVQRRSRPRNDSARCHNGCGSCSAVSSARTRTTSFSPTARRTVCTLSRTGSICGAATRSSSRRTTSVRHPALAETAGGWCKGAHARAQRGGPDGRRSRGSAHAPHPCRLSHLGALLLGLCPRPRRGRSCLPRARRLVHVNGSQAVGARPIDVRATAIDALVSAGFKWLCGPYGTGLCWLRPELFDALRPTKLYWLSALTADDLAADAPDLQTITPEDILQRLSAARISVAHRRGRIRVSPHVYNTAADIDRALDVLNS